MANSIVKATVTVTVEIEAGGSWSSDCTISQVQKQAGEESVNKLSRLIHGGGNGMRVVGEPKVEIIRIVENT